MHGRNRSLYTRARQPKTLETESKKNSSTRSCLWVPVINHDYEVQVRIPNCVAGQGAQRANLQSSIVKSVACYSVLHGRYHSPFGAQCITLFATL